MFQPDQLRASSSRPSFPCSGPCIGIQKVSSDEEALKLINDSKYGLTCSIWTNDQDAFLKLVPEVEAGTVYQSEHAFFMRFHPSEADPMRWLFKTDPIIVTLRWVCCHFYAPI